MTGIRAAHVSEANRSSGDWLFVDMGFSEKTRSCGFLDGENMPVRLTFADLVSRLVSVVKTSGPCLNLVIEAPLSVAFDLSGNPVGRTIERRNGQSRCWYFGLGCAVLVASTYLLRNLHSSVPKREIRLFEGFVSFKKKGARSNHCLDVVALRDVAFGVTGAGRIVPPELLAANPDHAVVSAFRVSGMDCGVPPVLVVD